MRKSVLVLFTLVLQATTLALAAPPPELPPISRAELAAEVAVQARHEKALLSLPGVFGVGLGYRDGRKALVVLVDEERPTPPGIPLALEGLTVVVERASKAEPANGGDGCSPFDAARNIWLGCHSAQYPRPVPMGVSTGPSDAALCPFSGGTLGFKACDVSTGTIGYVTNNHVATPASNGCPNGFTNLVQQQPGQTEAWPSCSGGWTIGTVTKAVQINPSGPNVADAAFVLSGGFFTSPEILDVGFPAGVPGNPTLNTCALKSGRTTGLTYGRIDLVNLTMSFAYCAAGYNAVQMRHVFRITPDATCGPCLNPPCNNFVKPGDSGSAVLEATGGNKKILGLIFARHGSAPGSGFANDINWVLGSLDVSLDLSLCP